MYRRILSYFHVIKQFITLKILNFVLFITLIILIGFTIFKLNVPVNRDYIFNTKDNLLLNVTTNSALSYKSLLQLFNDLEYTTIVNMSSNDKNLKSYFNCTNIEISEYTIPMATSFIDDKYSPIYSEFTTTDVNKFTLDFIKKLGIEEEFIIFVKDETKHGASPENAAALYSLNKSLGK